MIGEILSFAFVFCWVYFMYHLIFLTRQEIKEEHGGYLVLKTKNVYYNIRKRRPIDGYTDQQIIQAKKDDMKEVKAVVREIKRKNRLK